MLSDFFSIGNSLDQIISVQYLGQFILIKDMYLLVEEIHEFETKYCILFGQGVSFKYYKLVTTIS